MTHHVQFPPYLPRRKIDGEPHPVDAAVLLKSTTRALYPYAFLFKVSFSRGDHI
jgi:hypothetical protein